MDADQHCPPPAPVLAAWAVRDPRPLAGGQGGAFRAGDVVLKPVTEPRRTTWLAGVLDALPADGGVRIVRPARSLPGPWVIEGWSAWHWLEGDHRRGSWDGVLDVSRRFHAIVAGVPWAGAAESSNRWAVADRVAWGEASGTLPAEVAPLLKRRRPIDLPSQFVHGDLLGNVLFDDLLPPAVIDVSPYWRPKGYADAIAVADAVAWEGADDIVVEGLMREQGDQLLIRAVLFRVAANLSETVRYERVISLLTS